MYIKKKTCTCTVPAPFLSYLHVHQNSTLFGMCWGSIPAAKRSQDQLFRVCSGFVQGFLWFVQCLFFQWFSQDVTFKAYLGVHVRFRLVQGIFKVCLGLIQGLFRVYLGFVWGLLRVYLGFIQGSFRVYSGFVQG